MRILLIPDSNSLDLLGLGWKLLREHNQVGLVLQDPSWVLVGKGIYTKRHLSWEETKGKVDLVLCDKLDFTGNDAFRLSGALTLGTDVLSRKLAEPQRQQEFLGAASIPTISPQDVNPRKLLLVQAFFNGRHWVPPYFITFPYNHFLAGDLGTMCQSQGVLVIPTYKQPPLVELLTKNFESLFSRMGARGLVSALISVGDILEVCLIGYGLTFSALDAICEGLKEPLGDVLFGIAAGTKERIEMKEDYLIAVRLSIPPWPYPLGFVPSEGLMLQGLNDANLGHVHLNDMYRDDDQRWRVGLGSGSILKAMARGRNIREARSRVYRTLSNIEISAKQYRIDIGADVESRLNELVTRGLIDGKYEDYKCRVVERPDRPGNQVSTEARVSG